MLDLNIGEEIEIEGIIIKCVEDKRCNRECYPCFFTDKRCHDVNCDDKYYEVVKK